MPILFNQKKQEFHLYNEEISYIFCILPNQQLGHLYFGKTVTKDMSYRFLLEGGERPMTSYCFEGDKHFTLQHVQQEYPSYGTGNLLLPAFDIEQADGSHLSHFTFESYTIIKGKPSLDGLPHTYVEDPEAADTLEVTLLDRVSQTQLILSYTIYKDLPVLTRHSRFHHLGDEPIFLNSALSLSLDLIDPDYDWLHLDGAWGRERHIHSSPLHQGCQSIYSLKGASSAEHNPFIALKRKETTEHQGEALGFSLIYSGNFLAQVDVTPYAQARLSMGIHPHGFKWLLRKEQFFQTPEVAMVYSPKGLNGMSQTYHKLYRKHLIRGFWKDKERPILLNNWEAMTFDFDEEKILCLARKAAQVGIELFVMDDGWFGQRNHDRAGLGDWTVNRDKLPSGLTGIIQQIHDLDMRFGLWIEPEMVNKDSDLYRKHPDWILHHPRHSSSHGRNQYVLDFSREEVYQNIYQQLRTLLNDHEIDYIKWDMNRYMTEVFSIAHASNQQGEIFHRYILNVYRLYETLTSEFPTILFESCSSGGARFDPGMLYYAPQTWTSDDSDAIERLKIQYGTSLVYPLSSMGCHVSESPNQQVGRHTPLSTRAHVAYFGSFGYELDLSELSPIEQDEIAQQIAFYKKKRALFQKGTFTRLLSPFEGEEVAWQVQSEDKTHLIVGIYRRLSRTNETTLRLKLQGLDKKAFYEVRGQVYSGSMLMHIGLPIRDCDWTDDKQDFLSILFDIHQQST